MPGYPQSKARNPQRSPLSHLTLDPEGKEFLCRACLVLRNTHVAGSISHLCSGDLRVQKCPDAKADSSERIRGLYSESPMLPVSTPSPHSRHVGCRCSQ